MHLMRPTPEYLIIPIIIESDPGGLGAIAFFLTWYILFSSLLSYSGAGLINYHSGIITSSGSSVARTFRCGVAPKFGSHDLVEFYLLCFCGTYIIGVCAAAGFLGFRMVSCFR